MDEPIEREPATTRRGRRRMNAGAAIGVTVAMGAAVSAGAFAGEDDQARIRVPDGFRATVVADEVGAARHIAVRADGTLFVALRDTRSAEGGIVALRDTDGDGVADRRARFGEMGGTGIALVDDTLLYFAPDDRVLRYRVPVGALEPAGDPVTIVSGLPADRSHRAKSIVVRGTDLFVNHGSPSNACQVEDRQGRSPGVDPCPELETRAGIWRFDARRTGQTLANGERYATGIRNAVAMDARADGQLFVAQHGRDQLSNWGYSAQQNAELPSEELLRVDRGDDFGWPYCYHDPERDEKVLAPEYGGDGEQAGRCADAEEPVIAFPAHWAPNGLVFYEASAFPERYRGGAFLAFHGSWNRAPLEQQGYNVVFAPFRGGEPTGEWEVFADGFAGDGQLPRGAQHRPSGLAIGPDGALYVTDDAGGRIWRITAE